MRNTILVLKQLLQREGVNMKWTPTRAMVGDVLTKWEVHKTTRGHLESIMNGSWCWKEGVVEDGQQDAPQEVAALTKEERMGIWSWSTDTCGQQFCLFASQASSRSGGSIKKYKKFVQGVKKDPFCNSCQAKRTHIEGA